MASELATRDILPPDTPGTLPVTKARATAYAALRLRSRKFRMYKMYEEDKQSFGPLPRPVSRFLFPAGGGRSPFIRQVHST